MKLGILAFFAALAAVLAVPGSAIARQYPKQQPLPVETLESCRSPVYSDAEFRAMSEVKEVPEVRAKFSGSYMFVQAKPGPHPGVLFLHGRLSWVPSKCAAEPRWETMFDVPAWRWDRDPARVKPGIDIDLSLSPGPIMVVHGETDPLWSAQDGPIYLRRTLTQRRVASHFQMVPKFDKRIESWPALPPDRVQFYIFEGEPHAFSIPGTIARRQLMMAFLERSVRWPHRRPRRRFSNGFT